MSGKKTVSLPEPRIRNRADLINALTVASQLEHGLMLMYLFAGYSMKAFPQELAGNAEPPEVLRNKLRNWESNILRVARQEMEHLGFVCNLLTAIGGNQYFDRPNFPQPKQFWPVDLPIELEKFSAETLLRFLAYEKPQNLTDPVIEKLIGKAQKRRLLANPQPNEPHFTSIGDLYSQIREAFRTLPDDQLFLVSPDFQVDNDTLFGAGSLVKPVYEVYIFKVWDRQSAVNAIDEIIEQGEGTLAQGPVTVADLDPNCHYMLFRQVLLEYLKTENGLETKFEGARNCVRNPATELHQDTITAQLFRGEPNEQPPQSVAIITHPWSRDLMGIFNTAYESLMQMLVRLYSAADDTDAEVQALVNTAFFPMMTMVIRPLSELISLLPAFPGYLNGFTAGPGFEYFRTIGFLSHKPAAWIYIGQRLQENADAFAEAIQNIPPEVIKSLDKAGYPTATSLPFISQNLKRIAVNFKTYTNT